MIEGKGPLLSEERLQCLGLFTLEKRRGTPDKIEVYKIIHGMDKVGTEMFSSLSHNTSTCGHTMRLHDESSSQKNKALLHSACS